MKVYGCVFYSPYEWPVILSTHSSLGKAEKKLQQYNSNIEGQEDIIIIEEFIVDLDEVLE